MCAYIYIYIYIYHIRSSEERDAVESHVDMCSHANHMCS